MSNSKFIVQIGAADSSESLVETVPSSEKLVEARDVFDAHKKAFFDCFPGQEVLTIKGLDNKVLYTLKGGFIK